MLNLLKFFKLESGDIALVAVSVVGLGTTLVSNLELNRDPLGLALVVFLIFLFTLIGLHGRNLVERINTLLAKLVFYLVESILIVALSLLTSGSTLIMILPLAGIAVPFFRTNLAISLAGLYLGILTALLLVLLNSTITTVIQATLSICSGLIFVILITRIAFQAQENKREVERLASELRLAYEQLREYAMQAEELATTKERNRVAREIHDGLGHYLTVINMQLEAARVLLPPDSGRAAEAIGKAQTLTKEGLAEVRQSVAALRLSPVENKPLTEAIQQLVNESQATGILTELSVKGESYSLPQPIELTLYRVAQEGLTNVRKHSAATRADLILEYDRPGQVGLIVQDNGRGAAETSGGFGLLGIRERVQLLNGTIEQISTPGGGFRLAVEIPVQGQ